MIDLLYQPPSGFSRKSNGWLQVAKTPQRSVMRKLKEENADLRSRLDKLERAVSALVVEDEEKANAVMS